jgi:molybdopterin molybdotransferase
VKRPEKFISVNEAKTRLSRVLSERIVLGEECLSIADSLGRVASRLIKAPVNRPRVNLSAVDGYAVRSLDTTGSSVFSPVELVVKGVLRPGGNPNEVCVESGFTVRVHTGAPIPCGADAVVMDEDVKVQGNTILVFKPVAPGANIILKGEDISENSIIVEPGSLIRPAHIAALASIGVNTIQVYRKIKVSIIAIGDELIEPGYSLSGDKEYNSSAYIVYAQLVRDGIFQVNYAGIVPDDTEAILTTIRGEAAKGSDLIITVGGTGVSETDKIPELLEKHSSPIFRGVRMRPGRMTSASLVLGKPVLNLSGFPVAAWAGYELILRPAIATWLNIKGFERPVIYAYLSRRLPNTSGYTSIVRVTLIAKDDEYYAEPYMLRGSGVISSLLRTHGYVIIPEDTEGFEEGEKVPVYIYS